MAIDFQALHDLPGQFTSARIYAASDCNTLANAVPAAIAAGTSLLVGVWTEDNAHFEAEKAALLAIVQQYGFDWMAAVSVGSGTYNPKPPLSSTLRLLVTWDYGPRAILLGLIVEEALRLI